MVVRLLRRARREARLASARKEEVIEVVLSSRLGRDARTASPQGRFAPSPSLSLSLSVSLGETETFVRKREEAGASPRSPGAQRILTMLPARLSVAVVSFLPLAPPGRFASITINSFSCSSLRPARPVRILQRNSPKKIFGGLRTEKKGFRHPSIHDEGPGARLWFGNETPKRIPPPYTLFVLFLKRFLLYKSFSN